MRNTRPQLQVIIPSAACGGAIISFVLCPSELVKVSSLENKLSCILHFFFRHVTLELFQCRMQLQGTDTVITKHERYVGPLDCAVKTVKVEGVSKTLA